MTNEEAINHLKYLKVDSHIAKVEALDLAIKALEERPKGKWIELNGHVYDYRCSCCQYISYDEKTNFCPNCGARMER